MSKPKPTPPDLWFENGSGSYWLRAGARYVRLDQRDVDRHLLCDQVELEQHPMLKPFDYLLVKTQRERAVDYAGPLAGWPVGPFTMQSGSRGLVTAAANVPKPGKEADAGFLGDFFAELLGDKEPLMRFFYWLRTSYVAIRDQTFAPGQMVCFCGPSNCGKSFAYVVISELFGGRRAKAFDWLTGKSQFNGELAGAETWVIDDDDAQVDAKSRRTFGNAVKRATVSTDLRIRKMHTEAATLITFRRIVLAVNDEAENLAILPIMDPSILDKIFLCACRHASILSDDRAKNVKRMRDSIPGFLAWLLKLRIPDKLKDTRMAVQSWHDPAILEVLSDLSPEARLANIVGEVIFTGKDKSLEWEGSAEELERKLRNSPFSFSVEKLLSYSSACGVYLSRLAAQRPEQFTFTRSKGRTRWKIKEREE